MRLSKAPISEVILGVTFDRAVLTQKQIMGLADHFSGDFPGIEVSPPLPNEVLQEFIVVNQFNPEHTGPVLYRLRSDDRSWLVQVQCNKVYLNWVREDGQPVGRYPGLTKVLERFLAALAVTGVDSENCLFFELSYSDRIEWQEYINSISDLGNILNFSPPAIPISSGMNNVYSKFTYHEPRVGGFGTLEIKTSTSLFGKQLLEFSSILRGRLAKQDLRAWFGTAHDLQNNFFEGLFKEEVLNKWR
jgi:uncharacterized protein (TIGR04255 family)